METLHLDHGVTVWHDSAPIPGIGVLPVNAFLLRTQQPVLVDTGMPASREAILGALTELIDPADLRWIWLTHPDRDHTGALDEVLAIAPQARLVTTFLGAGILALEYDIAPERLYLLNPGQSLDMGDRQLTAFRPPVYDSPATTGFVDSSTGVVFSSDGSVALSDRKRITPQIFRPGDGRRTHCANTTPSSVGQDGSLSARCDSQPEDLLHRDDVDN